MYPPTLMRDPVNAQMKNYLRIGNRAEKSERRKKAERQKKAGKGGKGGFGYAISLLANMPKCHKMP